MPCTAAAIFWLCRKYKSITISNRGSRIRISFNSSQGPILLFILEAIKTPNYSLPKNFSSLTPDKWVTEFENIVTHCQSQTVQCCIKIKATELLHLEKLAEKTSNGEVIYRELIDFYTKFLAHERNFKNNITYNPKNYNSYPETFFKFSFQTQVNFSTLKGSTGFIESLRAQPIYVFMVHLN